MNKAGIIIVALSALLLGLSSIFARFSYDFGSNPQTLVLMRFAGAILLSGIFLLSTGQSFRLPRQLFGPCSLNGLFYTLGSGCLLGSMFFIPVSLTIIIFYTYPLVILSGHHLLERSAFTRIEIISFALAFSGLILALNLQAHQYNSSGIILASTASISISISYLISDRKLNTIALPRLTFHLAVMGLMLTGGFIILTGLFNTGGNQPANHLWILLTTVCFAAGFLCMFSGINRMGAVNTAMVLNLEPVFTVILSVAILHEHLGVTQIIGMAMVMMAILLLQAKKP